MVKMLIVVLRTISHSQIFLLKKNVSSSHFFSKSIRVYAIFNDQSFKNLLTNSIVSFEQLGPGCRRSFDLIRGHFRAERTKKRIMVQFENVF